MSLKKSAIFTLALCMQVALAVPAVDAKTAKPAGRAKAGARVSPKSRLPIWSEGIKVPYRAWLPVDKPREVLLCIHGLGFSSASYTEFGRIMASRGIATYAMDVRGFGQWLQVRGKNKVDFEGCLSDTEAALRALRAAFPGTPVFIIGESMGGAIALRAVSRNPQLVDGLISSVPSSDRYGKWHSNVVVGIRYVEDKDKPMNIAPEVVERSTQNEYLQKQWEANKVNRMELTPDELKQFNDFMKGNYDAAALVDKTPVLMLAGFKDKLVKPEGTIDLFNDLSVQNKLLMVVGDGEHLLLEENQLTSQLATLLVDWIHSEARKQGGVTAHP
jgi:alpha-beta hydrolase superfamily lysophospholipase